MGDLGFIVGWEDTLEKGMAIHFSVLAWRIPMDRGAWQATVHVVTKSQTQLRDYAWHTAAFSSVQSLSRVRLFASP